MSTTPNPQTASAKAAKPQAAGPNGRDANGKFAQGNKGGPGNPFARQVATVRKAFLNRATPEQIDAIATALIEKAKKGDVPAAKLVLLYTIGKPAEAVEPDRLDKEEFDHFVETTGMFAKANKMLVEPEPELPLEMLRAVRPAMTRELSKLQVAVMNGEMDRHRNPVKEARHQTG